MRWNVRQAIRLGMDPVAAIKMATINAARFYGLRDLGAVAPGYQADLVLLSSLKRSRWSRSIRTAFPWKRRWPPTGPPFRFAAF